MTESRLALSKDASVATQDGEAVVLHVRTGRFFTVNRAGAPLLEALARPGGATREELVSALLGRFGIDAVRAAADVDTWLGRLRGADLLAAGTPS